MDIDDSTFAVFDAQKPLLDKISRAVMSLPATPQHRLGLAVLIVSHFTGTAAGLLQQIAREKSGPELDGAAWSEEVMKLVVRLSKQARH